MAAGGTIAAVTIANAATAGCSVTYSVGSQWTTGFTANVSVTNLGDAIDGWTVAWDFTAGQTVTQMWNGSFAQSGTKVTVTNASYNADIASNATAAFGFNGTWNGSNPTPASFTLNGTTCTGQASSSSAAVPSSAAPSASATSPAPSASATSNVPPSTVNGRQIEALDRGIVSVRTGSNNLVSWRLLATDPAGVGFNVYRGSTKVNSSPITNSTNYLDSGAAAG
ncbi:MAG: cellulose binding domain-containing protein, partial [Micromonosporaceae bacterium]|nr:cellulose binding domain-containing protein [Micromonosporaceae bacterium]